MGKGIKPNGFTELIATNAADLLGMLFEPLNIDFVLIYRQGATPWSEANSIAAGNPKRVRGIEDAVPAALEWANSFKPENGARFVKTIGEELEHISGETEPANVELATADLPLKH